MFPNLKIYEFRYSWYIKHSNFRTLEFRRTLLKRILGIKLGFEYSIWRFDPGKCQEDGLMKQNDYK